MLFNAMRLGSGVSMNTFDELGSEVGMMHDFVKTVTAPNHNVAL